MSVPTLVFVMGHYIDGRISHYPGEEVPPGLIPAEGIARMLDRGELKEYDPAVRPSLFRVFHRFTGGKPDQPLTKEQLAKFTLSA